MSDTKVKSSNLILSALNQSIIPDTNEAYDLGTAEKKFRDLYLSTGTIYMGDNSVSIDDDGRLSYTRTVDGATKTSAMPEVDLNIAPETLGIQVQANDAGDNIVWKWTWTQSSLPYARIDITNETQLSVPLYNKGTYTIDNYAAYETYDDMTQTHKGYFKWVEGAGTDNLVSWATYSASAVETSISTINDGNTTEVQRYSFTVPDSITLPTLTQPSGIGYDVSFSTTGYYTFGANADSGEDMDSVAEGDNPTIGPLYRGSTYTFNLDSSLSSHPFYLTTDNGRNFVSGSYVSEYTDGVTGSRNNGSTGKETLTFTVPSDAPDELYYQCGTHSAMRGAITIKDLEVKQNDNGNYVIYFQHTHEGHATEVELRPIPSLVNQMCLVYDSNSGKFVPQDLATYVENTPSFKRKIRDVSGTAELVVEDGSTVIAKVNVYPDSTYLPLTNINQGDQAFATDTNILYIWDGSDWQQAGASNSDDLTEGSTNIFYTNTRVDDRVDTLLGSGGSIKSAIDTAVSNLIDSAPGALDTLNELAAAIGDDADFASTVSTSIATKAEKTRTISAGTGLTGGGDLTANRTLSLGTSGVSAGTYGSATAIPVIAIDTYGRITSASTATVSSTLPIAGDSGTDSVSLLTDTLTIAGGTGLSSAATTDTITVNLDNTGVTAGSYGSASAVPVITINAQGQITSASTTAVAGVSSVSYTASTGVLTINTSNGSTYTNDLGIGTGDSPTFAGATINGNISVSGTVDGRDIASDGTKLDGIESGATADQTASEILTLIKTVDGAGSGLDADTLDGISSASFLRSDADDTYGAASNTLTLAGVVRSNNNGNIYGANFDVNTTNKDTTLYAYSVSRSGSVVGGITIGGKGVFDTGLIVDTTTLVVDSSTNKVGIGTASPSWPLHVNHSGGDAVFINVNSTGGTGDQNAIRFAVDGTLKAQVGVAIDTGRIGNSSAANDFVLKSYGDIHLTDGGGVSNLYVDNTNSRVGIGTTNPTYKLDVNGSARLSNGGNLSGTFSGSPQFSGQPYFSATGPTGGIKIHSNGGITASGNYMQFYTAQTNGWRFNNNSDGSDSTNVNKFVISTSGNVTAAGDITANSDVRLKSDIQTITNAVETVKSLRGTAYIKDGKASIGVIAQEVEEVLPQVVSTADDEMGTKSVAYGNMVGLLIEAIKEQQEQIDELKKLLESK